jgi:transcriptional regulator of nitric oxide reductase
MPGRFHGTLNRHLPWQLQQLLQLKLLNEDGAFVKYSLALALTSILVISGNLDPVSKFVQVRKTHASVALQVFRVGKCIGCVHVLPEIAISSRPRDRQNK